MASSYSTSYFLELMETGANASTWGTNTNNNLKIVDAYGTRVTNVSVSSGISNVAAANASGSLSDAAAKVLKVAGTLTGETTITIPNVEGNYLIDTTNVTLDGNSLRVAPYGQTSNYVELNENAYAWVYVLNNQTYNGFSKFGDITVSGDISNVTGNVTVTGNTTLNGNVTVNENVAFTANVSLADNDYLNIGTGDDLQIFHDASDSSITSNTGSLLIDSDSLKLRSKDGEEYLTGVANGAVTLYYDDSAVFATSDGGVTVTGKSTLNGNVAVDTDVFFVDATNDAVGFGTTSPEAGTFNIVSNGQPLRFTGTSSSGTGGMDFHNDTVQVAQIDVNAANGAISLTSDPNDTQTNSGVNIEVDGTLVADFGPNLLDLDSKLTVANSAVAEAHTLSNASTTVALDLSVGNNFTLTMNNNMTLSNPTNETVGQCGFIILRQDATGTREISFGSEYKFIGGSGGAPNLASRTANQVDRLDYVVVSDTEIHVNATGPYS